VEKDKKPSKGTVGMMLGSAEIVLTASGRRTTPFPKIERITSNRKAANEIKAVDRWLMQNALDEAISRGDNFNARQFRANLEQPQQADKDCAEEYLFGYQPPVARSFLNPLSDAANTDTSPERQRG
jgi:hypothetical protein